MTKVFVAYPSQPPSLGEVLERAKTDCRDLRSNCEIATWRREDPGGEQVVAPIIEAITNSDIIVADVTRLNFNVTYELGYGIGLGKRGLPVRHSAIAGDLDEAQQIGIFDTLLWQNYATSAAFIEIVTAAEPGRRLATDFPYDPLPLYMVLPQIKDDDANELTGRARKMGLRPRTFDPAEEPRLSAIDAVRKVASSYGVVVPLQSNDMANSKAHNIRCAFVAGVAHALNRPTLILQKGNWATPLDIRDEVRAFANHHQLREIFQEFGERVIDLRYSVGAPARGPTNYLATLNIGDPVAEIEEPLLGNYFLERDEFRTVLDGRASIVVGRKGAGKTAVYFQVRDHLKAARGNVILDLAPEAYQLKKLKDLVLRWLAAGSKEFLLAAFWEYVLLLEICGKIIQKDQDVHKRNYDLFEPYQRLLKALKAEPTTEGVSFSDRLLRLIDRIGERYSAEFEGKQQVDLSDDQLTNVLYKTALKELRNEIIEYARNKDMIYVLFDNIDKGWNANGLEDTDVIMIRTLLEAARKLGQDFRRHGIDFKCAVFLRNDIYDILLSETSDRGKETRALIDWNQPDLLRHMVRKRLLYNEEDKSRSIDELWAKICTPIIHGENSLNYLIDRSLMRPRFLLLLLNHCKGNAINFNRNRMDEDDIEKGLSLYSTDVITEVDLEIRDVFPTADKPLYVFLGESREMRKSEIIRMIAPKFPAPEGVNALFALLLWHGVLGFRRDANTVTYIYDVNYDLERMQGIMNKLQGGDPMLQINPAFWSGLELKA